MGEEKKNFGGIAQLRMSPNSTFFSYYLSTIDVGVGVSPALKKCSTHVASLFGSLQTVWYTEAFYISWK